LITPEDADFTSETFEANRGEENEKANKSPLLTGISPAVSNHQLSCRAGSRAQRSAKKMKFNKRHETSNFISPALDIGDYGDGRGYGV